MSDELERPDPDKRIGKNLASLRGALSQQGVADLMRQHGHKWSQATVWSVEKGERPLRLSEAESLASLLGGAVHDLLIDPSLVSLSTAAGRGLEEAAGSLREAIEKIGIASDAVRTFAERDRTSMSDSDLEVGGVLLIGVFDRIADLESLEPVVGERLKMLRSIELPEEYRRFVDRDRELRDALANIGGENGEHQAEG